MAVEFSQVIKELKEAIGEQWVITDKRMYERYLTDETADPVKPKPVEEIILVKPGSAEEVSKILKIANKYKVPVFPRGGGTGLVGGAIPTSKGIVLSLERLTKIEIDKENLMAVAEAGVTLAQLIEEADKAGLSFPLHPGDEGATVGGLVACNAGGARAVRTGIIRSLVKGIEVVLPTGEILKLGGKLLKNNTGYNLMHLFIGSEGTLGVITKAILRLFPRYPYSITIVVPFENRHDAISCVPEILRSGVIPLAIEYVERDLVEKSAKALGLTWPCKEGRFFLIIILAEISEDIVYSQAEKVVSICEKYKCLEPVVAERRDEQENILKIRSEIYKVLKPDTIDILDVTVPPAKVGELIDELDKLGEKYGFYIPVYGHVGDGNLHPHVMKQKGWTMEDYERLKKEIYDITVKLGGVITGEHGIGAIRRKHLKEYLTPKEIELMKNIKKLLDPNNILNPGKVLPE